MSITKKAIVRGINFSNKGAEAMALTISQILIENLGYKQVLLNCDPPPYKNQLRSEVGFYTLSKKSLTKVKTLMFITSRLVQPTYLKLLFNDPKTTLEIIVLEKEHGKITAFFDAAGFTYSDECSWGASFAMNTKVWSYYCYVKKIPIIFLPQSWGPFQTNQRIKRNVEKFINLASIIFIRDQQSLTHLSQLDTKAKIEVHFSNDIVNLFNDYFPIKNLNQNYPTKIKSIGISPNARIVEKTHEKDEYICALADLIRDLSSEYEITLFANEIDDLKVVELIKTANPDLKCNVIQKHLSVFELRDIIRSFDIHISSRFHCLVFALSNNIPSISIGWSHKYKALLSDYGMEKYNFSFEHLDSNKIIQCIKEIDDTYTNTVQILTTKNLFIKTGLKVNVNKIVDELK
ncbi:MAG: polysaccharide pyruvyl transferase family protein [Mangrovibacterium sp.]